MNVGLYLDPLAASIANKDPSKPICWTEGAVPEAVKDQFYKLSEGHFDKLCTAITTRGFNSGWIKFKLEQALASKRCQHGALAVFMAMCMKNVVLFYKETELDDAEKKMCKFVVVVRPGERGRNTFYADMEAESYIEQEL